MSERLEGEFHYATWDHDASDASCDCDGTFEIHRKSDGVELAKWFYGNDGPEPDAKSALESYDETARHFTNAAVSAERERVNGLVRELSVFRIEHGGPFIEIKVPPFTEIQGDSFLEVLEAATQSQGEGS